MNVPVEAQSLSSLNYLLANPPQYPRNPTHQVHEPLVLYIVRVPGSKDVFLTPLKPPTKASISLEAIQTSLYYLHVSTESDEPIREAVERASQNEQANGSTATQTVQRKPLPNIPHVNYPPTERPIAPPTSSTDYQQGSESRTNAAQQERHLTSGSSVRFSNDPRSNGIQRKPAGPRRFRSLTHTSESEGRSRGLHANSRNGALDGQQPARPTSWYAQPTDHDEERNDFLAARPPLSTGSSERTSVVSSHDLQPQGGSTILRSPGQPPKRSATITLIRRDPTSGAQWNIGTIDEYDVLSDSNLRPVAIGLNTPGYLKFTNQPEIPVMGPDADAAAVRQAMRAMESGYQHEGADMPDNFSRVVEFRQQPISNKQSRRQYRTNSIDSIPNYPIQNKLPRSVFSFMSPWQGLCSFTNGIDGRSLKCRHTLPATATEDDGALTANIAELRFNLAWSALTPRDANRKSPMEGDADTLPISKLLRDDSSKKERLRRGVQQLKNLSKDLRDSHDNRAPFNQENRPMAQSQGAIDEEYRLSLKLGREKAGGGYKGNSAKLGKLIIDNEGLKMGDLAVAACMGVWWQHYMRMNE